MRELLDDLETILATGDPFAVAVITRTWRSAPRPAGTFMLVTHDGRAFGSLSGGCIEGAVHEAALEVLHTGTSSAHHYGVSGNDALRLGLTCGGEIDIHITPFADTDAPHRDALEAAVACLRNHQPTALAIAVTTQPGTPCPAPAWECVETGPGGEGGDAVSDLARHARRVAAANNDRDDALLSTTADGTEVLVCRWSPPPRLVIFGAIDFSRAATTLGKFLGYHVTVCDARATFATRERFPDADEVITAWPHRWLDQQLQSSALPPSAVVLLLTHDPKFDIPALSIALRQPFRYVGALGSRRTTADRAQLLREAGLTDHEIARLHAPIGLDLDANTPEETAVAIMAEVLLHRGRGTGAPLGATTTPIHHTIPQDPWC